LYKEKPRCARIMAGLKKGGRLWSAPALVFLARNGFGGGFAPKTDRFGGDSTMMFTGVMLLGLLILAFAIFIVIIVHRQSKAKRSLMSKIKDRRRP